MNELYTDKPPVTVLQVVPSLVTGGVERGTIEIAAALKAAKWIPVVVSSGGPMVKELEAIGVTHVTITTLASKKPGDIYRNIDEIADVINEYNADIVHARSRAPAWSAYYAAKQTDKHFVTTFHNAYGGKSWLKRKYNMIMAKGELVIAISEFVAAYAKNICKVPMSKLRMIPRGVDTDRFDRKKVEKTRIVALREKWQLKEGETVIMLPGRLSSWKGQDIFIEAIAMLGRKDITCLIVGSGDVELKHKLESDIAARGLKGTVRLMNECDDMPAAFCLADIVVSASTRPEGFGRVIVEAQAMGVPVIATRHGGAEETVLNGKTGWLITPGKAKILAEALGKILAMPVETRQKIGDQARVHTFANFTTKLMQERTLAVYEEVMKFEPPEQPLPMVLRFKNWLKQRMEKPAPSDDQTETP